jgi:hypothetical protein
MHCRYSSRLGLGLLLILIANAAWGTFARAAAPLALCAENGHYFSWHGRPTVLVTSGEHYGAVLNLDFNYLRYLDTLLADGLNHTRAFSGTYRETQQSFGISENTLAPRPNRYLAPWARSDRPGYFDGGNKFDLTRWDEAYFSRLRKFLAAASQRGIAVELNLYCPLYSDDLWKASPMHVANNVNGVGNCPANEVLTLKHPRLLEIQVATARKIVREVNEFDNLYFEVCNEPYFGGVTEEWQRRIADTIVDEERRLPVKHLISMNIANGRKKIEHAVPCVSIFNFHYCVPPDTVAMNYGLNRVIGENETGFRGPHDLLYRTEAWDFLLAGGGLFNNLDYSFTAGHPDGTLRGYASPGGGSPELRKQLGILKRFLDGFPFQKMRPDRAVIKEVSGRMSAYALALPGKAYAVYIHVPLPEKPDKIDRYSGQKQKAALVLDLPPGRYDAQWIDTKTGRIAASATIEVSGGVSKLTSPEFVDDVALRITVH